MANSSGDAVWSVHAGGQQFGPYTAESLVAWCEDGKIPADAIICSGAQSFTLQQFISQRPTAPVNSQAPALTAPPAPANVFHEPVLILTPVDEVAPADNGHLAALATIEGQAPAQAADQHDVQQDEAEVFERDQIVVIGRRQSGKTIFLASIYGKLWKSLNGMTAKALSGETHKELMEVNRLLTQGQWPSSTVGATQVAMELVYHDRKRLLVALDYAGEKFSDAFVKENVDDPVVKDLLKHIDRAAAVMLLIDPSIIAGKDMDAAVDDDFGMVQAVQRIRNWPGGDEVPIVLVLTKMDLYQRLIDRSGGVKEFIRQYFPALVRMLKEIPIFQVSAVQAERTPEGPLRPRADSATINVENPLRYCLAKLDKAEQKQQHQQMEQERQASIRRMEMEEALLERKHKTFWTIVIVGMVLAGLAAIALIVILKV